MCVCVCVCVCVRVCVHVCVHTLYMCMCVCTWICTVTCSWCTYACKVVQHKLCFIQSSDWNKPEKKLKDFLKGWMSRIKSDAETQACVQDLFQEQVISERVCTDIRNAKTRREANGLLYQHLRNQATVETMFKLYEVWDICHGDDKQNRLVVEMREDMQQCM